MSLPATSRRVVLARRPGRKLEAADLRIEEVALPALAADEIALRTRYVSIDPFLRLFLDETVLGTGNPGLPLGAMIPGAAVAEVVESRHPRFPAGQLVEGRIGWTEWSISNGSGLRAVSPNLPDPSWALGVAGLPGITAYCGLIDTGGLQAGETVVISSAAGSVGSIAGQIARIVGATPIGIAGGPAKCAAATAAGFAECVDYRDGDLAPALRGLCGGGADLFLDNVGGHTALAGCMALRRHGRMVVSGLLSQYQSEAVAETDLLAPFLSQVMTKSLSVRAFTAVEQATAATYAQLEQWAAEGRLQLRQEFVGGLDRAPSALADLLEGRFTGKVIAAL